MTDLAEARIDLWRISFDEPRFADEDVHHFSFGSARKVSGTPIRWCSTHQAEGIENHGVGLSDECWRVVWVPHDEPEGVDNGYDLCRIVDRILIDPKEET